jgi:ribosomal-protein-alanine N-acetyltransferase
LIATGVDTARLALRRPTPADIGAIFTITSDPRAYAHNPADAIATADEAAELYARWDAHWERFGFGYWVLRFHRRDAVLGFCGLKYMTFRHERVLNLFYRLEPAAWGQGIATEAASAAVEWAAAHRPGERIIARVRPENIASGRVAVRAGLHRDERLDGPGEDGPDELYTRVT